MSIEIECLRRWLNEIADRVVELEDKVQDLETKTASDLSQTVVAESATSEEQDCLWVARDKRTDTLYIYEVEPVEQYCETFAADDEEEKSFRIDFDLFPQVTFENSPQKLVLESSISKTETVEDSSGSPEIPEDQSDGYVPTVDDFFYTPEKENSEKPNKQDNYPSHWPRKADGSGVQVGDCVEIRLNDDDFRTYNIVSVDYEDQSLEFYVFNFHDRPSPYSFNECAWSNGYQFRFPEKKEDAFTELRAKLVELEQVYKKDLVNLDAGTRTANLSQHREIKIACCRTALLVIKNIREVIE